jgi:hypothetical protein
VLTDTPIEGAWCVADGICQGLRDTGMPSICSAYSYPSQWLSGADGDRERRPRAGGSSKPDAAALVSTSSAAGAEQDP